MDRRGSDAYIEATQVLQNKELPLELLRKLNALRAESVFTDMVLCVGREEIPCHRNILAVSSPYFRAMFTNDLRESREGRISFNEQLSSKTLRQLVDYVYTGRVEISVDNAQDMLAAASLFHYPEVMNFCCEFLRKHLHPSNCLGIEDFSHLHSCSMLEADAHRYALENFVAVCECEEFLELTVARLLSYISSDLIEVRTERIVFEAMLKWADHDPDRHKSGLCTLMKGIRFSALDVDFLQEVVKPNCHIAACPTCSELVSHAFQFHAAAANDIGECHQVKDFEPRPSTVPKEVLVIVGSVTCENKLATIVDVYDPRKDRWTSLPELPVGLVEYSVAAVGNDIFVTGGIRDGCAVATVWRFVSSKRHWYEMPPLVGPRARHASASWNSRLYVIGGVRNPRAATSNIEAHTRAIETIECLNMSSTGNSEWAVVGLHPCPRVCSHVIPFKDQLVEVGGTLCGAVVPTMESYHCSVGRIKYSGEQFILPEPIEYSKVAVIDGVFYIVWENSRKMISLNPDKRTFRLLKDMKYTHIKGAASVVDRYIYVVGGATSTGLSRNVERYNPVTNEWDTVKSMSQGLSEVQSVSIKMC